MTIRPSAILSTAMLGKETRGCTYATLCVTANSFDHRDRRRVIGTLYQRRRTVVFTCVIRWSRPIPGSSRVERIWHCQHHLLTQSISNNSHIAVSEGLHLDLLVHAMSRFPGSPVFRVMGHLGI